MCVCVEWIFLFSLNNFCTKKKVTWRCARPRRIWCRVQGHEYGDGRVRSDKADFPQELHQGTDCHNQGILYTCVCVMCDAAATCVIL